ncbi:MULTISPECIES: ATP-binding protein [unclassified Flavonifractor]|uniref:ATP-binding protein n=1 Tax=unclassified Flavonifractor TaxID=2629267 RepID=UPI000B39ACE6|nr:MULTISPECIES: ATP-binding protein [unclassified Flavonifractor]OUN82918.1 hypothetical protein B5G06_09180 [Flavonifractor sp. An52]OUQ59366.1 hypothetical protein B5E56_08690 [Flavonifractor sp. An112]HIZ94061.1 ATP-binding protein [Candidatus Flavonifractor avicola]
MDREERLREAMEREKANRIQQKRKRVFGSAQGLMDCTFDRDNGAVPQLAWARQYVEHWPEMRRENMGLLFWGPAGTGKTFAAACIANALVDLEVGVRMITLGEALLNLFGMSGEERIQYLEVLTTCGLLILDDFGVERRTPYAREQVYEIVNRRYLSGRPMVVTTNLTLKELKNADRDDSRIHDRVLERCVPVCFDGTSLRQEKTAERIKRMQTLLTGGSPAD